MNVATTLSEFGSLRVQLAEPVGFVPTMGYLHEGHLSLARLARSSCASVIASIFVNPTQFAPTEDLASYPRNLDRDLELLEKEGVDLVLAPSNSDESSSLPTSTLLSTSCMLVLRGPRRTSCRSPTRLPAPFPQRPRLFRRQARQLSRRWARLFYARNPLQRSRL